jgi:mannose-6-phosphate isomerase-like protein (cupin superfamily)
MQDRNLDKYRIARDEPIAQDANIRVSSKKLTAGECIPWHHHSNVSDHFFCMEGPMVVETRPPRTLARTAHVLKPGQTCTVPPMTEHYVHGLDDGPCEFMLVQGVGVYDFVPDA